MKAPKLPFWVWLGLLLQRLTIGPQRPPKTPFYAYPPGFRGRSHGYKVLGKRHPNAPEVEWDGFNAPPGGDPWIYDCESGYVYLSPDHHYLLWRP